MEEAVLQFAIYTCGLGSAVFLGVLMLRLWQQRHYDHMRRTYELSFPSGMTHEQVLDFLRSLGGLPGPRFLRPVHAIVFEMFADEHGVRNFIHIPGHVTSRVDNLLEEHIDGIVITPIPDKEDPIKGISWQGHELGLVGQDAQLRVEHTKGVSKSVRASFKALAPGDAMLLQWVIFHAKHRAPTPDDKVKLSDTTFRAIGRIGVAGDKPQQLLQAVYGGLASADVWNAKFTHRPARKAAERLMRRSGALIYPMFFNALEFSAFMGWELEGGSGKKARSLAVHPSIPERGIVLASSDFHKSRGRLISLPPSKLAQHTWIIGPTGSGKSALLHVKAEQLARMGMGFAVIEPKGDLARDILATIPKSRINDVIFFDPSDEENPIGLNLLAGPDPHRTAAHIVALLHKKFPDSWGPRTAMFARLGAYTAAVNGLTIFEVKEMMRNPAWRAQYVRKLKDLSIKRDWTDADKAPDMAGLSVTNKIDQFTANPMIQNIVGQKQGLDFRKIILGKKILLVPLDSVAMGEENAAIMGEMILDGLWMAARSIPEAQRTIYTVIGDEFQKFVESADNVEDMLAMARSYQLGIVAAHQYTSQLDRANKAILPAMQNNARTKIVFATSPADAHKVAEYFPPLKAEEIENLPLHGVAIRMMTEDGMAPTVTGVTFPPPKPTGFGPAALAASRAKYSRPRAEVAAEIAARYTDDKSKRRRPSIGRVDAAD